MKLIMSEITNKQDSQDRKWKIIILAERREKLESEKKEVEEFIAVINSRIRTLSIEEAEKLNQEGPIRKLLPPWFKKINKN